MTTGNPAKLELRTRQLRWAVVIAIVIAVVLGAIAVVLYSDLLAIGPCSGGFGVGVTTCPANPGFQAEQLGHSQFVNGSYVCSFIVYPLGPLTLYSTNLTVWGENLSGTLVGLSSVALYSADGSILTNYSLTGTSWTADNAVEIFDPVVLTATSSTTLVGHWLVISDTVTHLTGYNNVH